MNIKSFIRYRLRRLRPIQSMNMYKSYDYALEDSLTYEDPEVIQVVSRKTESYRNALHTDSNKTICSRQTLENMFVLSHVWKGKPLVVLEIGGACGASYFELNHLLPGLIKGWHVVETAAMSVAGKRVFENDKLNFHDDLNTAVSHLESLDLLIAQGVLQYMRDPLNTLDSLVKLGFAYVYITRTVVGDDITYPVVTKQVANLSEHGPGAIPKGFSDRKTSQPLTIIPFNSIKSCISVDYLVLYSFAEDKNVSVRIGSQKVSTKMISFLLQKV